MNKLLKEEIERFQLLSKYDNKKTLDENYNNVLNEQSILGNLFKWGGREAGTLSKTALKEVEELFRLIPTEMKKFGVDAAEVTAKLEAKSFTSSELGSFRKTVFKNTQNAETRKELADDMVKSKAFQDFFTSTKEKKIVDDLISKGYSGDDAKFLIDRYKRTGGKFLDDIKSTVKPKAPKLTNTQRMSAQSLGSTSARKSYAEIAWEILQAPFRVGGFIISNFWKIFWLAGSIGVAYYLWNNLNQKIKKYPKCLYRGQSPDDFKKMYEEKLEYIIITETGNEFIDENGGGRFYIDNTFETDNRKYKGKWSDEDDLDILVTLSGGEEHSLPCSNISDFEDETDIREKETSVQTEKQKIISSWDGKYEKCDDFPMSIGCINDGVIGTVQICLGLPKDGKFTPKVLDALEKEGYGFELTFDIYKRIQSKCGMSSSIAI